MDVLQILGTNSQSKAASGQPILKDGPDWIEIFENSSDVSSSEIEIGEEVLLTEAFDAVDEMAPAEIAIDAETEFEPADAAAKAVQTVSVQEFSTTQNHVTDRDETKPPEQMPSDKNVHVSQNMVMSKSVNIDRVTPPENLPLPEIAEHPKMVSSKGVLTQPSEVAAEVDVAQSKSSTANMGNADQHVRSSDGVRSVMKNRPNNALDITPSRENPSALLEKMDRTPGQMQSLPSIQSEVEVHDRSPGFDQKVLPQLEPTTSKTSTSIGFEIKEQVTVEPLRSNLLAGELRVLPSDIAPRPIEFALASGPVTSALPLSTNLMTAISHASPKDQPILLQITQAIETAEAGKIELRLDPAELGKVRITMAARDGIMQATISAERPETLELLRRNSDSLDLTFSEQGFGETEMNFEQFDQDDPADEQSDGGYQMPQLALAEEGIPHSRLGHTPDGLDIKI